MQKDMKQLCAVAEKQGFRVSHTRKGHVRFLPPNGGRIVIGASTPSDVRSMKNLRASLQRVGLQLPRGAS